MSDLVPTIAIQKLQPCQAARISCRQWNERPVRHSIGCAKVEPF